MGNKYCSRDNGFIIVKDENQLTEIMVKESSIESVCLVQNPFGTERSQIIFYTEKNSYGVSFNEEKWSNILRVLRETGL